MGFGPNVRHQVRPCLMPNIKNIQNITVGKDHIIALSGDGSLYSWGNGENYQLGRHVEPNGLIRAGLHLSGQTALT